MPLAGGGFADDGEGGADHGLCRAYRITIHCRGREGRLGAPRDCVFSQYAADGLGQRDGFGADGFDQREKTCERLRDGDHLAAHSAVNSPDLPPDLCVTRISVIRMPRSTALTMS